MSKLEGAVPITLDNATFNALVAADISLLSKVESPDTTTDNGGNVALTIAETDCTWLVRANVSVSNGAPPSGTAANTSSSMLRK